MSDLAEVPGTQEVFNKYFFAPLALEGGSHSYNPCAWHLVGLMKMG